MVNATINNKFLINAPAGSGKTTSIRNYLKDIYLRYPESKVLCITYTNRAAEELKKDLDSSNIYVSTIHSYIHELIKPFFAQKEALDLYWTLYGEKISNRIKNAENDEKIAESNQYYIEKFGSLSVDIIKEKLIELSYGETPFTSLYSGRLSHDDLLMFAYLLTEKYPVILRKIRNKYNYIFIDEYQDTSAYVLKMFYNAVKNQTDVKLYLLGDRMQQIYHNYDGSFEESFKEFDVSQRLETNHRSIGKIITILNNIYNSDEFIQKPSEDNKNVEPDISPKIIINSHPKDIIALVQNKFPQILTLYLMNKEKYGEIGALNLYECYNNMEMYSFGKKYTPSDVLSDLSDDNPDILMKFLFFIDKIFTLYSNGNYGSVISTCKRQIKYFNASSLNLQHHNDKKSLKEKFDFLKAIYDDEESSVKNLIDGFEQLGILKEDFTNKLYENSEYTNVFDISFVEVKNLSAYLNNPYISTQHGVKGESHTSVIFVSNDSNINPNVRMYSFFELWSKLDFSLPEFEDFYYSFLHIITELESKIGLKINDLTKDTYAGCSDTLKQYCEFILEKYKDNKIFESIYQKDFLAFNSKPNVTNARKVFKVSKVEGILTAYKLFYVGCSRARKNLLIYVDETKISNFKKEFIEKVEAIGFSVGDTL